MIYFDTSDGNVTLFEWINTVTKLLPASWAWIFLKDTLSQKLPASGVWARTKYSPAQVYKINKAAYTKPSNLFW